MSVKRFLAGGLEENRACAPHVCSRAESVAAGLLGGDVIRRSEALISLSRCRSDAEVEYFDQLTFGHQVRRLQV
jgi:hypothetical protein